MSAVADIRAFIEGKAGRTFTTSELAEECEAEINAVYNALSVMAKAGELVRVDTGKYLVPDEAPTSSTEQRQPASSGSNTGAVLKTKHLPNVPETTIEVGIFSTGRIVIRRGKVELTLEHADAEHLVRFLERWRT